MILGAVLFRAIAPGRVSLGEFVLGERSDKVRTQEPGLGGGQADHMLYGLGGSRKPGPWYTNPRLLKLVLH